MGWIIWGGNGVASGWGRGRGKGGKNLHQKLVRVNRVDVQGGQNPLLGGRGGC